MSKRNRRPDKGQPGSRAAEKAGRTMVRAQRAFDAGAAGRFRKASTLVMAELCQSEIARWRAPYTGDGDQFVKEVCAVNGFASLTELRENDPAADLTWLPVLDEREQATMAPLEADGFYEEVPYGLTGVGYALLADAAADAHDFEEAHGRPMRATDPPADLASLPDRIDDAASLLTENGIDPAFIAAYVHTGYFVAEDNQCLFTDQEKADWAAVVNRVRAEYPTLYEYEQALDLSFMTLLPSVLHPALGEKFFMRHNEVSEEMEAADRERLGLTPAHAHEPEAAR